MRAGATGGRRRTLAHAAAGAGVLLANPVLYSLGSGIRRYTAPDASAYTAFVYHVWLD